MQVVLCEHHGDPDGLACREGPDPIPGAGEMLVRVEAAGVNFADAMMRRGLYPGTPDPPHGLGFEVSGVVEAAGADAPSDLVGQRVMGVVDLARSSGYATRSLLRADHAMRLPARYSFEEGAAFPVVFLTAYGCLRLCAHVAPGETVLIHAAAGGVGTAAVRVAQRFGARVLAAAGSDEKLDRVCALGADVTINYRREALGPRVLDATEGRGVDVVLDSIGGELFDQSLRLLAPLGRIVTFGIASQVPSQLSTSTLLFHSWSVLGFHMSALDSRPGLYRECAAAVEAMAEDLRPVVGHRYPLSAAADAHRMIESRDSFGKIVLVTGAGADRDDPPAGG